MELKQSELKNWSLTWRRIRGKTTEQIDTSREKYICSTNEQLTINSVCKDDEGNYQAVLSRSVNGKTHDILSNITHLEALGGIFHLMKHLQKKKWSSFICKHFKPDSFKNRKAIFYCLGSFKRTRGNHYPLQLRSLREVTKSPYDKLDKRRKDVRIKY